MKTLAAFLLLPLFIVAFACNTRDAKVSAAQPTLLEKVRQAEQTMAKNYPRKSTEDPLYEKYLPAVEECSERYEECIEKCAHQKKEYDTYEDKCIEELSLCEKELPKDWKTV
jgi:hypothetical protein